MPQKKESNVFGTHVEFRNGGSVTVQAWGWSQLEANLATIGTIIADFAAGGMDFRDEAAIKNVLYKQFNRLQGLIAASLSGGEADLSKIYGLDGAVSVLDAMLEENGVFAAQGKLMELMEKFTAGMKMPATPQPNPSGN